jgi:hypothetical protein
MRADQDIVVEDLRVMAGNEAHSSHVGRQRIHLVDASCRFAAVLP